MRNGLAVLLALALAAIAGEARATKPCPPSPCDGPSGRFDSAKCREAAAWVAIGTITEVVHHPVDPPLAKDFAEFTFTVQRWEKGTGTVGQKFQFKVGWCENGQELPKDTSVPFRLFGAAPAAGEESRYLHLEPLARSRP